MTEKAKTATLVKDNLTDFAGHAALYKCEPPMSDRDWHDDKVPAAFHFVVVSAARVLGRPETYIFGADCDGAITDWMELPGSAKDTMDHAEALRNAGYAVAKATEGQS